MSKNGIILLKVIENEIGLWLYLQLLSQIFYSIKSTERDIIKNARIIYSVSDYRIYFILRPPTGNKCVPKNICLLQLRRNVSNGLLMSLNSV